MRSAAKEAVEAGLLSQTKACSTPVIADTQGFNFGFGTRGQGSRLLLRGQGLPCGLDEAQETSACDQRSSVLKDLEESARLGRPNERASREKAKRGRSWIVTDILEERQSATRDFRRGGEMNTKLLMAIILAFLGWSSPRLQASSDELVVHEWGTFTSISGADSQILEWTPYRGGAELPGFVYGGKHNARGTVRMETPVIYFYSPKRLTCNVRVGFPQGEITEYYPMPEIPGYPVKVVQWKDVELLPGRTVNFPVEQGMNHYYHARATEAVPLRVWKGNVIDEYEKFLFYRGVGTFDMPLSVQIHEDKVTVRQPKNSGIGEVIFFQNHKGRTGCFRIGLQSPSVEADGRLPDCSLESLKRDLEVLLAGHGLYQKEAEAMVKTWEDSWFEEGYRMFYVLPRQKTDAILPLAITPKPDKLVRVLVGRMEIMTPETTQEMLQLLTRLKEAPGVQSAEVSEARQRYGRFLAPMIRTVLEKHAAFWDPALEKSLVSLGLPPQQGNRAR